MAPPAPAEEGEGKDRRSRLRRRVRAQRRSWGGLPWLVGSGSLRIIARGQPGPLQAPRDLPGQRQQLPGGLGGRGGEARLSGDEDEVQVGEIRRREPEGLAEHPPNSVSLDRVLPDLLPHRARGAGSRPLSTPTLGGWSRGHGAPPVRSTKVGARSDPEVAGKRRRGGIVGWVVRVEHNRSAAGPQRPGDRASGWGVFRLRPVRVGLRQNLGHRTGAGAPPRRSER